MLRRIRRRARAALKRRRRALTRRLRRFARKRVHRAAAAIRTRHARRRTRRTNRRLEIARTRAAAGPLAARSITGTPRPARAAKTAAPRTPALAPGAAAPMAQRVKRTKDGKFNGSATGGKKSAAKKTTKTALSPEARKAAQTQRLLTTGNKRVARVDKRTDAADQRIDRMFRP